MLQHYYKGEAKITLIYYYTGMVQDQLADGRSHILFSLHTVRSDQSTTMDRNSLQINNKTVTVMVIATRAKISMELTSKGLPVLLPPYFHLHIADFVAVKYCHLLCTA